jgi:predicted phage terminase large subunit-like protein
VDAAGLLFDTSRVRVAEAAPLEANRVRYWDKASVTDGGDYSAGVLMARTPDGLFWVEHVERGRWSAAGRNAVIRRTAELDHDRHRYRGGVAVWVEQEGGSGGKESAEISVRELAGYNVRADRVTGDKATRAMPLAAQVEAGNVHLVRGDWNAAFLDELNSFPEGSHDDQVDAAAGAFAKLALGSGDGSPPMTAPAHETVMGRLPADTWR